MFNAGYNTGMENPYEASEVSHEEGYDNVEHGGFEAHHYPQEAYEPPVRPRLAHFAGSNYWTPTLYESQESESQYVENHGQYESRPNDEGTMMMRENMNHDLNKTGDDTNNCEETISQITATALAEVQGVFRYSQANAQRGTNRQTNEPDEEKGELGEAGLSLLNNQDPQVMGRGMMTNRRCLNMAEIVPTKMWTTPKRKIICFFLKNNGHKNSRRPKKSLPSL